MPVVQSLLRRRVVGVSLLSAVAGLIVGIGGTGCQGSGDFCVLGYSTAPNFDPSIRSVYIPVFKNTAFHTSPYRGIEADITQAIVDELNRRRSPIRVVSDCSRADTELVGTIVQMTKVGQNINLQNQLREYQIYITASVVWRDLRTGRVLSGVRRRESQEPPQTQFDPNRPPPPPLPPDETVTPVQVVGIGRVIPELGETNTTGTKAAIEQLARQIVNMMEQPW